MKNIITIGREYGSGGHEIGERLAEELGFTFYNKQLISKLAENLMIPETVVEQAESTITRRNIFQEHFPFWVNDANDQERYIFEAQGKFICKLAEKGNCVFAGRRADYYLRNNPNAVHLFFYAPMEDRVQRIMGLENCTAEEAAKKIEHMDRMRKNSYEYTTGRKWGDRHNYNRMIDTSAFTADQVVKELVDLIRG